jgi:AcrR family transcriptional regulator
VATNKRGRDTRRRILDATAAAVAEQGLELTVEDVAQRADVTRVTVYRHFSSREELLTNLLLRDAAALGVKLREILEAPAPAEERLVDVIVCVVADVRASPHLDAFVTRGNPASSYWSVDPDALFLDAVWEFFLPYFVELAAEIPLRDTPERTLDWVLRQVLLQLTVPSRFGRDPATIRRDVETFLVPSIRAG